MKDEYIRLSLVLPSFGKSRTKTIHGHDHSTFEVSFPTKFCLTTSPIYGKILFSIVGFGLCLEWHIKYDKEEL